ncbi:MAG: DMT family transporter [Flavobacteriaceae bacterium]
MKPDPIHIFWIFGSNWYLHTSSEFNLKASRTYGFTWLIICTLLFFANFNTKATCYQLQRNHVNDVPIINPYHCLAPFLYVDTSGISTQFPYVLLLAVLTTAIGHTMFVHSLKHFSSSTASIMTSALPVYGIIIAYFFLDEIPSKNVIIEVC